MTRERRRSRGTRRVFAGALAGLAIWAATGSWSAESPPTVILDMDTLRHRPTPFGEDQRPAGRAELVEGMEGKAVRFEFVKGAKGGFFAATVPTSPEWDRADGISFWVKGDGTAGWGGLEMIDREDFSRRYAYCFPIDSTEWRKITVPWRDLIPELPGAPTIAPGGGQKPSNLANLWFGKWWYWRDYPACSFTIDRIALEPSIPVDSAVSAPPAAGLARLAAKLRAGQRVTIVTMGDSLTDKAHWANRDVLWSELLAAELKRKYGAEVEIVNVALGGTQLSQNLILMPRWLARTPRPDLVAVWFGYNDWDSGMRGERFEEMLRLGVDRIRRMTGGHAEVLLMTTCPALRRWETMEELAEAARRVAAEKKTGLADVAAAFHREGADEPRRAALFAWDATHLGAAGHKLTAQTVADALAP